MRIRDRHGIDRYTMQVHGETREQCQRMQPCTYLESRYACLPGRCIPCLYGKVTVADLAGTQKPTIQAWTARSPRTGGNRLPDLPDQGRHRSPVPDFEVFEERPIWHGWKSADTFAVACSLLPEAKAWDPAGDALHLARL